MTFEAPTDRDLQRRLLNQNVGDFSHTRIGRRARVWVAGGVDQALQTAFRLPCCDVLGTDRSAQVVAIGGVNARALAMTNLTLRCESVSESCLDAEFDYVLCASAMCEDAAPTLALERLRAALRPDGILELRVCNRFHWTEHQRLRQASRLLARGGDVAEFDREFAVMRRLLSGLPARNRLAASVPGDERGADPDAPHVPARLRHSYTVESLRAVTERAGLEMLRPAPRADERGPAAWELCFDDQDVQACYTALDDYHRWQVTNLLRFDTPPSLWFYFQRSDSPQRRRSECKINAHFLRTTFRRVATAVTVFRRDAAGTFRASGRARPYPSGAPRRTERAVYQAVDGQRTIGEILRATGEPRDGPRLNELRVALTSSAFPYLETAA